MVGILIIPIGEVEEILCHTGRHLQYSEEAVPFE